MDIVALVSVTVALMAIGLFISEYRINNRLTKTIERLTKAKALDDATIALNEAVILAQDEIVDDYGRMLLSGDGSYVGWSDSPLPTERMH